MKNSIILLLSFLSMQIATAQDWEAPVDYDLDKAEDYAKYENDMIEAAKWLEATPFTSEAGMHRDVSKFVFDWVDGSPNVTVEINMTILDFNKKNSGMLVLYMAACSRYVLEGGDDKNLKAKHTFALKSMMKAYQKDSTMKKDKKMEKLIEADNAGQLDAWLEKNMKFEK